jgi:Uma2 family endonuclease
MAVRQTALLTAENYRALPETGPRYQLVQGELHMSPAPNRYHQEISANIEFLLRKYLAEHPIGKLYDAPFDVYLSDHDVFQPDILFVHQDRLSILTKEGADGAPTLVVEVLSPSTAFLDQSAKKRVYTETGVEELWLVDPETKRLTAYRLQENTNHPAAVCGERDYFTSPCFPSLVIQGKEIFKD